MSLPLVDDGLRFSVHAMVSERIAAGATWFTGAWQWSRDGERYATIGFSVRVHDEGRAVLTLDYSYGGEPVRYDVRLKAQPCRFGGLRWFAICPHTGRRVAKLYKPCGAHKFLARQAWGLAYRSQRDTAGFDRLCRRRDRILFGKLKGEWPEAPLKPKWMRWRTYEAHVAKLDALHEAMDMAMIRRFGTLAML